MAIRKLLMCSKWLLGVARGCDKVKSADGEQVQRRAVISVSSE